MTTHPTPPETQRVRVWQDQVEATVRVAGADSPLIFLHGDDGPAWTPFLDALAASHRVLAPDFPGTGPDPDAVRRLDDVHDLVVYHLELFDALGLPDGLILIGHSFGAMVACEIAAVARERIRRLVLIDPVGLWRDDAPVVNRALLDPKEVLPAMLHDVNGPLGRALTNAMANALVDIDRTLAATWALGCTQKFTWPIPDRGLRKRIHRISAPTLIVHGASDGLVPPVYADEFASRIPRARTEIVAGAGHLPHVEQAEHVLALVEAFLAEDPS